MTSKKLYNSIFCNKLNYLSINDAWVLLGVAVGVRSTEQGATEVGDPQEVGVRRDAEVDGRRLLRRFSGAGVGVAQTFGAASLVFVSSVPRCELGTGVLLFRRTSAVLVSVGGSLGGRLLAWPLRQTVVPSTSPAVVKLLVFVQLGWLRISLL